MFNKTTFLLFAGVLIVGSYFAKTSYSSQNTTVVEEDFSLHDTVKMEGWVYSATDTLKTEIEHNGENISAFFNNMAFGFHEGVEASFFAQLGLKENYYAEFYASFVSTEQTDITFIVQTNENFNLLLDDIEILGGTKETELAEQKASISIHPGKHAVELRFTRTTGPYGLDVYYSTPVDDGLFFIGESSQILKFKSMR